MRKLGHLSWQGTMRRSPGIHEIVRSVAYCSARFIASVRGLITGWLELYFEYILLLFILHQNNDKRVFESLYQSSLSISGLLSVIAFSTTKPCTCLSFLKKKLEKKVKIK